MPKTTKEVSKALPVVPDNFRPDNIPAEEQLQELFDLIAEQTAFIRPETIALEAMNEYFQRATALLRQLTYLQWEVAAIRDAVADTVTYQ
jgi:hypothetical protein